MYIGNMALGIDTRGQEDKRDDDKHSEGAWGVLAWVQCVPSGWGKGQ